MRAAFWLSVLSGVIFQLFLSACAKAQSITTEKIMLGLENESLETALKKIEQISKFHFFYRETDVKQFTSLNLKAENRTIEQTLVGLLQNTNISFRQIDSAILLELKSTGDHRQVKGQVINKADKKPIANASVFLSNAMAGGTTADDGTFTLNNVRPGNYNLVVSIVGFEQYNQAIVVTNKNITLPTIIIDPKAIILNEVKISSRVDPDRERNFGLFKDQFLGTSALANNCKIINPEVLDLVFDEPKNTLTASSSDFLVIENHALGYRLKYLLKNFRIDFKENTPDVDYRITGIISHTNGTPLQPEKIHFDGSVFFEELKGTKSQQLRWQKQREKTYLGSEMHFLRSVIQNQIDEEGFRVLKLESKPDGKKKQIFQIPASFNPLSAENRRIREAD